MSANRNGMRYSLNGSRDSNSTALRSRTGDDSYEAADQSVFELPPVNTSKRATHASGRHSMSTMGDSYGQYRRPIYAHSLGPTSRPSPSSQSSSRRSHGPLHASRLSVSTLGKSSYDDFDEEQWLEGITSKIKNVLYHSDDAPPKTAKPPSKERLAELEAWADTSRDEYVQRKRARVEEEQSDSIIDVKKPQTDADRSHLAAQEMLALGGLLQQDPDKALDLAQVLDESRRDDQEQNHKPTAAPTSTSAHAAFLPSERFKAGLSIDDILRQRALEVPMGNEQQEEDSSEEEEDEEEDDEDSSISQSASSQQEPQQTIRLPGDASHPPRKGLIQVMDAEEESSDGEDEEDDDDDDEQDDNEDEGDQEHDEDLDEEDDEEDDEEEEEEEEEEEADIPPTAFPSHIHPPTQPQNFGQGAGDAIEISSSDEEEDEEVEEEDAMGAQPTFGDYDDEDDEDDEDDDEAESNPADSESINEDELIDEDDTEAVQSFAPSASQQEYANSYSPVGFSSALEAFQHQQQQTAPPAANQFNQFAESVLPSSSGLSEEVMPSWSEFLQEGGDDDEDIDNNLDRPDVEIDEGRDVEQVGDEEDGDVEYSGDGEGAEGRDAQHFGDDHGIEAGRDAEMADTTSDPQPSSPTSAPGPTIFSSSTAPPPLDINDVDSVAAFRNATGALHPPASSGSLVSAEAGSASSSTQQRPSTVLPASGHDLVDFKDHSAAVAASHGIAPIGPPSIAATIGTPRPTRVGDESMNVSFEAGPSTPLPLGVQSAGPSDATPSTPLPLGVQSAGPNDATPSTPLPTSIPPLLPTPPISPSTSRKPFFNYTTTTTTGTPTAQPRSGLALTALKTHAAKVAARSGVLAQQPPSSGAATIGDREEEIHAATIGDREEIHSSDTDERGGFSAFAIAPARGGVEGHSGVVQVAGVDADEETVEEQAIVDDDAHVAQASLHADDTHEAVSQVSTPAAYTALQPTIAAPEDTAMAVEHTGTEPTVSDVMPGQQEVASSVHLDNELAGAGRDQNVMDASAVGSSDAVQGVDSEPGVVDLPAEASQTALVTSQDALPDSQDDEVIIDSMQPVEAAQPVFDDEQGKEAEPTSAIDANGGGENGVDDGDEDDDVVMAAEADEKAIASEDERDNEEEAVSDDEQDDEESAAALDEQGDEAPPVSEPGSDHSAAGVEEDASADDNAATQQSSNAEKVSIQQIEDEDDGGNAAELAALPDAGVAEDDDQSVADNVQSDSVEDEDEEQEQASSASPIADAIEQDTDEAEDTVEDEAADDHARSDSVVDTTATPPLEERSQKVQAAAVASPADQAPTSSAPATPSLRAMKQHLKALYSSGTRSRASTGGGHGDHLEAQPGPSGTTAEPLGRPRHVHQHERPQQQAHSRQTSNDEPPITRSHCGFERLWLPVDTNGSKHALTFIVPQCALQYDELAEEKAECRGDASEQDIESKIAVDMLLDEETHHRLARLVGQEMVDETWVLPNDSWQAYLKGQSERDDHAAVEDEEMADVEGALQSQPSSPPHSAKSTPRKSVTPHRRHRKSGADERDWLPDAAAVASGSRSTRRKSKDKAEDDVGELSFEVLEQEGGDDDAQDTEADADADAEPASSPVEPVSTPPPRRSRRSTRHSAATPSETPRKRSGSAGSSGTTGAMASQRSPSAPTSSYGRRSRRAASMRRSASVATSSASVFAGEEDAEVMEEQDSSSQSTRATRSSARVSKRKLSIDKAGEEEEGEEDNNEPSTKVPQPPKKRQQQQARRSSSTTSGAVRPTRSSSRRSKK